MTGRLLAAIAAGVIALAPGLAAGMDEEPAFQAEMGFPQKPHTPLPYGGPPTVPKPSTPPPAIQQPVPAPTPQPSQPPAQHPAPPFIGQPNPVYPYGPPQFQPLPHPGLQTPVLPPPRPPYSGQPFPPTNPPYPHYYGLPPYPPGYRPYPYVYPYPYQYFYYNGPYSDGSSLYMGEDGSVHDTIMSCWEEARAIASRDKISRDGDRRLKELRRKVEDLHPTRAEDRRAREWLLAYIDEAGRRYEAERKSRGGE